MPATLVIANKAYSSWSLRPWLLMRALDIPFDEIVVPLHQPGTAAAIARYSPAGKLPVLVDGAMTIWDSLAIIEYIADTHPALPVWPEDRAARALARALSAEMHSGFVALRRGLPMNMRRAPKPVAIDDEIVSDIRRIEFAWADARARFGRDGSFLFGAFCAADAMFAPVINRLHAYAVEVSEQTATYMAAMMAMPGWQDWHAGAAAEGWRNARTDAL